MGLNEIRVKSSKQRVFSPESRIPRPESQFSNGDLNILLPTKAFSGGHPVFKDPSIFRFESLGLYPDSQVFGSSPQNEAPIGLWVRGGLPHIAANLVCQRRWGLSVWTVTAPSDGKHVPRKDGPIRHVTEH